MGYSTQRLPALCLLLVVPVVLVRLVVLLEKLEEPLLESLVLVRRHKGDDVREAYEVLALPVESLEERVRVEDVHARQLELRVLDLQARSVMGVVKSNE